MIQTLIILPSPILKDYIRGFEIREFDTMGLEIVKPVFAYHESLISIFLKGKPAAFNSISKEDPTFIIKETSPVFCGVMGIQSQLKGALIFKGAIKVVNLQFTPTGFTNIFKIPAHVITDRMYNIEQVFGHEFSMLHEQLMECSTQAEIIRHVEMFLIKKLSSKPISTVSNVLQKATTALRGQRYNFTIEELAYHSNMSLKTFERKFVEQVGITPKLFNNIRRFNAALEMKMAEPNLKWTAICHRLGYFDQMHMVKDFTKFTGEPPTTLFKSMGGVLENILIE